MKNLIYWNLLIVICFFGCGGTDDHIGNNPVSPTGSQTSMEQNEDKQQDESLKAEEVLAELEQILVELEEVLAEVQENAQEDEPPVQDFDPPKMTDSSIAPDAKDIGLNRVIWIKFDEPIDEADITLETEDGDTVETQIVFRNQTIELRRLGRGEDFHLKPLTTYIIRGTVSDEAGNETEVKITFSTGEDIW